MWSLKLKAMSVNFNKIASEQNFFLIAGPCVVEGEQMAFDIAGALVGICRELDIPLIFKGSYRKANRSRLDSFTGIGDAKALDILSRVGREFGIPVITDVHECHEVDIAAEYVDALQIPAFLCRQTDLLLAAGRSNLAVNIKKGQFLSPLAMQFAADKVVELVKKDGKTYVVINDYAKVRELFGELLAEIQRIKSTGDYDAARKLVEAYAVKVDPELHAEVLERYKKLNLAPYKGFVNPKYEAVTDADGNITDITVTYDEGYAEQMLRYSKDYSVLPSVNN